MTTIFPDPESPISDARPVEVPRADYLLWAKRRPHPANDLGRSDVLGCTFDDVPGMRESLELSGRNDDGWMPLVDRIAARYGVEPSAVATATGTSGANFLVCAALIRPGDDVVVEKPAYDPLLAAPRLLGANLVRFERRFEEGFALDLDRLAAAVTPRTRLIIVTNPHNPTGVLGSLDQMRALGEVADRHGCYVLADEIYLDAIEGPRQAVAATLSPRIITTSSLTKAYGLAGLRCGWALAAPAVAEELRRVRDLVDGSGSILTERAAAAAFEHLPALAARARGILEPNFALFERFIAAQPALEWVRPDGGTVAFPRLKGVASADAFVARLFNEFETAVVPGRFFEAPAHMRIALGIDGGVLARGLEAIARALE
ncbi:MAG: aminotransferase class I/II-fold pyridoxal phosphate-dependent enzyme [Acidobacteria bacterium]|nr:aminotransferase class I/II-fold pyridoxal phosphate-dependent enzyme [Acidobacteriota bacterium]